MSENWAILSRRPDQINRYFMPENGSQLANYGIFLDRKEKKKNIASFGLTKYPDFRTFQCVRTFV